MKKFWLLAGIIYLIFAWHAKGRSDTLNPGFESLSAYRKYYKKLPADAKTEEVRNNYAALVKENKEIKKQIKYFNRLNRIVFTGQYKKGTRWIQYLYDSDPGFERGAMHTNLSQWLYRSAYHQKKLNGFLAEINQSGSPEIIKRTEALYWLSEYYSNPHPATKEKITRNFLSLPDDEMDLYNHNLRYVYAAARIMRERNGIYDSSAQALLHKGYNASLHHYQKYRDNKQNQDSLAMREMARLGLEHAYYNFARVTNSPDSVLFNLIFSKNYNPDSLDNEVKGRFNHLFHLHANGEIGSYNYQSHFFNLLSNTQAPDIILNGIRQLGIANLSRTQKEQLQDIYFRHAAQKPFSDFWNNIVEASLKQPFGESFLQTQPTDSLWTLVYFWGSWCGACTADLPEVEKVYRKWVASRRMHFVAYDFQTPNAREFLARKGLSFTSQLVTESFTESNGIFAYPTCLLVRPDGRYIKLDSGNWIEQLEVITGLD